VAVVAIAGAALRFWDPASFGIDHYDEGVYVLSALGLGDASLPDRIFPDQIFFAPPLYFGLAALAHAISGLPLDTAAVLVSAFFGALTIPLVWWTGRSWFNPAAGIAASALLALSDFHISLSRAALTDATFLFFFLLAAALAARALERGSIPAALLAGLAAGLAWNTKYHGWLALAVAAGAHVLALARGGGLERWKRSLVSWLVMIGTAVAVYLPWASYVASLPGGYGRLAEHQRLFLESDWLANLWQQAQRQGFLDGRLTDISLILAAAAALIAAGGRTGLSWPSIAVTGVLAAACLLPAGWAIVLALAMAGLVPAWCRRSIGSAIAIAWLAIFSALTPLYRPYARLFLPLTIAACLLGGCALSWIVDRRRSGGSARVEVVVLVAFAAALFFAIGKQGRTADPFRSSRGLAAMAGDIASRIPRGSRVKVIEEPPLAYYMHRLGYDALRDVAGIAVGAPSSEPIYVITGPYGQEGSLVSLGDSVRPIADFRAPVKDLRAVDDADPPWGEGGPPREHAFRLFAVMP